MEPWRSLTNRSANIDAAVMPNGRLGDNPIGDITVHGEEIYGPEIDDLIREIRDIGGPVAPPQEDVFAQDGRELYDLAFRAEGNESLRPEFRARLLVLRDRVADREFWDWAFADDVTEELRGLVMSCWDPIGVADSSEAADETTDTYQRSSLSYGAETKCDCKRGCRRIALRWVCGLIPLPTRTRPGEYLTGIGSGVPEPRGEFHPIARLFSGDIPERWPMRASTPS